MSSAHTQLRQHFLDSAASLHQCAELLAEPAATVAESLLTALMNDGKLLVCGNGSAASLANSVCLHLTQHLEQERMALAALSLCANPSLLTQMAQNPGAEQLFAKQIHALGKQHDVLWVISTLGNEANLLAAVDAAHERDMPVVAITGGTGGELAARLYENDLLLNIPQQRALRIWEAQTVLLHALCDQIDALLLGTVQSGTHF